MNYLHSGNCSHIANAVRIRKGIIKIAHKKSVAPGYFRKKLSKDFHKAFELRQRSDYKVIKPVTSERAEEILRKAEHFLESVKTYLQSC